MEREKITYSGPLLEADFYPICSDGRRLPTRAPKTKPSRAAQEKYNQMKATKKLIRLVNANFDGTDYLMHPTYNPGKAPQDEEQARRDIVNYLRRVKTRRESELKKLEKKLIAAKEAAKQMPDNLFLTETLEGLKKQIKKLSQPFKYIYVIEKETYKRGVYAGRDNWHFHLFLSGGLPDKVLEGMWGGGLYTNADNYQPEKFGPEAAAKYMAKNPEGSKRFSYSKNLTKPKEKIKDGRVSRLQVERMCKLRVDDNEFWEKRYPGYKLLRTYPRYNQYNGHWYLTAVLYKIDGTPPKWELSDYLTEDF